MNHERVIAQATSLAALLVVLYSCSNREPPEPSVGTGPSAQAAVGTTSGSPGNTNSGAVGTDGPSNVASGNGGASSSNGAASSPVTGAGGTEVVISTGGTGPVDTSSCSDETYADAYTPGYQLSAEAEQQAQSTLDNMSATEKANQMRGTEHNGYRNFDDIFRTLDDNENGVKGFLFRDGPRGANLDAPYVDVTGQYSGASATAFPVSIARGAAFDLDLEYRIGVAIGDETLVSGNTMQLAPTVNVLRHPAWGRAQETYGEDPYQSGRLGAAFTVGVQEFIPTCVKHYLGNDVEGGRESFDARMDDQTLREIYGYPFEMIIRDAGVACVMAAYNEVNGTKSAVHTQLLTQILRDEWGFQGIVMTDWWAMPGNRTDSAADALDAVEAGLDMELPWSLNYLHLEQLLEQGDISESDLDVSAKRILEQKYRFNVASIDGQRGLKAPTTSFSGNAIGSNQSHVELAYEAALKGAVLLKNDGVLPIALGTNVAVLGLDISFEGSQQNGVPGGTVNFATGVITGDSGSSRVVHNSGDQVSIAQGLTMAGANVTTGTSADVAANADFVVVVVGRTPDDEGEEYTGAVEPSGNFLLDGGAANGPQNSLVQQAAALGKPMAVVMIGGTVIDLPWIDPDDTSVNAHVATVMAWYPGMVGGRAIGDLLMGVANFSGKLPMTWPRSWGDEPTFTDGAGVDVPYDHGYRHFDRNGITPLFPFGHGLSYSNFSYDELQLGCSDITRGGVLPVVVNVSNSGTAAGEEIIYVFTSFTGATRAAQNPAPVKELKGFYRVKLEPAEAKQVTIQLRMSDLKYWDSASSSWAVDTGTLNIQVGPNAANLPLTASVPVL